MARDFAETCVCVVTAGYLTMNETDTRSLCIPFPVDGWDSQGSDNNDTAGDIITAYSTASIMEAALQPSTFQLGAPRDTGMLSMAMPLSLYPQGCNLHSSCAAQVMIGKSGMG